MNAQVAPVGYTAGTSFAWNTRGQVIAAAIVLPALAIIGVALRVWSRFYERTGFGLDDVFILPALICVIGLSVTLLFGVAKQAIAHTTPPNPYAGNPDAQLYQITPEQVLVEKIQFVFFTLTVVAYGCIKLSVLFFYRRLFVNGTSRTFDYITKVAIGIIAAWTLAFFFAEIFFCGVHPERDWGPLIDLKSCVDGFKYDDGFFISDLITDILVICLPIPLILKLQMTMRRRLAVVGVMLLGAISIVAAVVRLVFAFQAKAAGLDTPTDVDEALTTLLYWNYLEAGISFIATNLPSIYFLFRKESLQSFANSIRNVVSLDSLQSAHRSNSNTGGESLYSKKQNASKSSHVTAAAQKEWEALEGVNSFAMSDMKHGARVNKPEAVHAAGNMGYRGDMV